MTITMADLPKLAPRRGGSFPPSIERVNERWTVSILTERGLDVHMLQVRGINVRMLASCVSMNLVDIDHVRVSIESVDVDEFNQGLEHLTERLPAVAAHPDDLVDQCYHDRQLSDGMRLCSCDVER